jgi:hypothetical protein
MTGVSAHQPVWVEVAATGHLVVLDHDAADDLPWVVSIAAGEGPGEEVSRFDVRQPAELLVDDLVDALAIVARTPVCTSAADPRRAVDRLDGGTGSVEGMD